MIQQYFYKIIQMQKLDNRTPLRSEKQAVYGMVSRSNHDKKKELGY